MTRAELAALVAQMTEGPWTLRSTSDSRQSLVVRGDAFLASTQVPTEDAAGIVALRNHAAKLLAVCEAAEAVDPRAWTCLSGDPNEWEALDKLRAALRDLEGA